MSEKLYTLSELSALSGVDRDKLYSAIAQKKLEAHNLSLGDERPRWRVSEDAWSRFLASRSTHAEIAGSTT